jgi:hypothetical protein
LLRISPYNGLPLIYDSIAVQHTDNTSCDCLHLQFLAAQNVVRVLHALKNLAGQFE